MQQHLAVHNPVRNIVNSDRGEWSLGGLSKVLLFTDFSDNSQRALEHGFSRAAQYDAEVILLHVLEQSAAFRT
jgi:Universal stress protein family